MRTLNQADRVSPANLAAASKASFSVANTRSWISSLRRLSEGFGFGPRFLAMLRL